MIIFFSKNIYPPLKQNIYISINQVAKVHLERLNNNNNNKKILTNVSFSSLILIRINQYYVKDLHYQ